MAKNRFTMQPKQMAPSMSPSYSHTVSAVVGQLLPEEEDDNDICPVCDGECTCGSNVSRTAPPPPPASSAGPLTMEELSRQYKVVTSSSTPTSLPKPQLHNHQIPKPSLKIKLTLPHNLIAKRRTNSGGEVTPLHTQSRNADETMYDEGSGEEPVAGPSTSTVRSPPLYQYPINPVKPIPRKRGRPRKLLAITARDLSVDSIPSRPPSSSPVRKRLNPKANIIGHQQKQQIYAQKITKTIKSRAPPVKKNPKKSLAAQKRRRVVDSDISSSSSSDDDMFGFHQAYAPNDDAESAQFPTFVSASALSSMDSDNESSDLSSISDFSDLSIEKEEEGFILSEMQSRARANRELMGDGSGSRRGANSQNNEWIIRPRKKSVGLSDVELDSDATEEDEDEDVQATTTMEQVDEEDEEDEPDAGSAGGRGLVTGWSDDEESSFDADIFFSNLSTSSDSESSSDESMRQHGLNDGDDATESDDSTEAGLLHMREELENLPLELAEGWDGQMVFTNGMHGGQAIIDIDFEVNASQFIITDPTCNPNSSSLGNPASHGGSDVEMSSYGSDLDDGYEEDGGEGEGDTTDEELVGEDDLPNERAMRLFNFPFSVNAINPLSTVSPMVTPAKHGRAAPGSRFISPTPADILSGKIYWDSDEMDEMFDRLGHRRSISLDSDSRSGPRQGMFPVVTETRQAIINDSHIDIPSPHPRFNRNRRGRRFNNAETLMRKHLSTSRHDPSFVSAAAVAPDHSPLNLRPSVEITVPAGPSSMNEAHNADGLTTPIDLDDVLDAAFLHPDPADSSNSHGSNPDAPPESATTADESDSNNKELKHLHRWDVISVGAFRQTRENAAILDSPGAPGWSPDIRRGPSGEYGNILKASPFGTMLWPTTSEKGKRTPKRGPSGPGLSAAALVPPRGDGDRTPTGRRHGGNQQQQHDHNYAHKSKKELKKEKKLKRKSFAPNPHNHHAHQYHSHQHHPNSKSRSMASTQRTSFLSSVPPLNL
ncbi:hypothetical protein FA15DRAFT_340187 [Coprinopsis marcescibilis]|uniref:Uncharacterized protein n=1 Tax=Coprinopsis marcescibilis TaxID=230819 RepID=A0A5C3KYZ4_COPMA|nr:hypothetical protein FA15DRAFT_340187 [Coprinopsis marcescibilis]